MEKPGRPLGLSLAIVSSALLFSVLPIIQVIFFLSVQQQFQNIEFLEDGGAVGGSITGVDDLYLLIPVINGLIFLVIAVMAWRGKPQAIRVIFMASVVFITSATLLLTLYAMSAPADLAQGIDSGGDFNNTLLRARLGLSLLISAYVLWYVNRGPARAFYRGYYLPDPAR